MLLGADIRKDAVSTENSVIATSSISTLEDVDKKVRVIGNGVSLEKYQGYCRDEEEEEGVDKSSNQQQVAFSTVETNKEAVKKVKEFSGSNDLTICHLNFPRTKGEDESAAAANAQVCAPTPPALAW